MTSADTVTGPGASGAAAVAAASRAARATASVGRSPATASWSRSSHPGVGARGGSRIRSACDGPASAPVRPSTPGTAVTASATGPVAGASPRTADGTGGPAGVRLAVELGYPSDLGAQCGAVRRHVTRRLRELAQVDVVEVVVDVARLHPVHAARPTRPSGAR